MILGVGVDVDVNININIVGVIAGLRSDKIWTQNCGNNLVAVGGVEYIAWTAI